MIFYSIIWKKISQQVFKYLFSFLPQLPGLVMGFFYGKRILLRYSRVAGKWCTSKSIGRFPSQRCINKGWFGGYKKLPLKHQSCWAHLLRKSHEAAVYPTASQEVILLHEKLKGLYNDINQTNSSPFYLKKRKTAYLKFSRKLKGIIDTKFQATDAKKNQIRIANQNTNLLTALLHENVPLTNNRAEQGIRPLVVTRKISGGSQSKNGADTHTVHMSILQSNLKQKKPLIRIYRNLLKIN